MAEVTLSSKNQIVIPREAREALRIRSGERLLVVPRGDTVILLPKPDSYTKATQGMSRGMYRRGYLNKERASWR